MRFIYFTVLLLSLISLGAEAAITVYANGALSSTFNDYSWVQTRNPSDPSVVYKGSNTYSFLPGYYAGVFFACTKCINVTRKDSITMYVNFGAYTNTILSVSLVQNTATGTTNFPALSAAPQLSKYVTSNAIVPNAFNKFIIPITAFGAYGSFDGIQIIGTANYVQNYVYMGQIVIGQVAALTQAFTINGAKSFALGVNLPNTPNNYGRDFGTNAWGYAGVNTSATFSNASTIFRTLNKNYGNAVRWNLFTDARAGITFAADGTPTGFNPQVFGDMDKAILIAKGFKAAICFSIFDITFFQMASISNTVSIGGHSDVITDTDKTAAFIKVVLNPILQRYGANPAIFAWEIVSNVEKILLDLPAGSPAPATAFNLVSMNDFWTFASTVGNRIKTVTTVGQLVTVGSLSLKWINIYTPAYANANGLPIIPIDFYSVGYDTWMDTVSYFNDSTFGTVNASPFQQNVGDLSMIGGAPVVVNSISTPSANFSTMYNVLSINGYAGVFENLATINWNNYRTWGASNTNNTNWPGLQNPSFPAFPTTSTTTTASSNSSTGIVIKPIPTDVTFVPTYIYADNSINSNWMDYSWALVKNSASTAYVYLGTTSYVFDPSNYDGLYFYCKDCINTQTDYVLTFYMNGGAASGQIINFALVDDQGNKAGGGGLPLSAFGITLSANTWTKVVIPLYYYPQGLYSGIQLYGGLNSAQSRVYMDQMIMLSYPPNTVSAIVSPASSTTFSASHMVTFIIVFISVLLMV